MSKKNNKTKNAIGMIIFTNPLYLVGACLSAWTHREFINKYNLEIDLVVIVDKIIYKYKDELLKYFDKIKLIDLIEMKLSPKYNVIYKYSQWMKYSISKWEILNFEDYEKILFLDIDILPIDKNFYSVFDFDTPCIMVRGLNLEPNILAKPELFLENPREYKKNEYSKLALELKHSLDAGFILLEPSKTLFDEYIEFIKICEGTEGYISKYDSGVDETTLLLFFIFYKKIPIHIIPYNYAPIPWDKFPYDKNKMWGINFLSMIKPWVKLPITQWTDENIWHRIAKKALNKHSVITKIYIKYLIDELYKFYFNWKKNILKSNSPYNMESIKSDNLKNMTFKLFEYLKTNPKDDLTLEQMEYIIKQTVKIHELMNKKLIVPIRELELIV
jgi:hypothetical protein